MPLDPRPRTRFVSRPVGVAAAAVLLLILLGCMSISIGKFSGVTDGTTTSDGVYCQEGEINVPGNSVREVFYPAPYTSPPNLEISDTFSHGELLLQNEASFKVRNTSSLAITVSWKARGVRVGSATVLPQAPAEPALPPPAPVPSESTEPPGKAR
jgi:hypothetical protein